MSWPFAPDLFAPLAPWFDRVRRDLPWRAKDLEVFHPDPYAVLVSELMLQQTQVATVIPYFTRWMDRFPTAQDLADADDDTVHKAWEGLGYYRRARFLKAAAGSVAADGWPGDLEGLCELPGLGPYSAAAVGAIAFQWPTPALDGNAFRVLARLLLIEGDPKDRATELRRWLAPALEAHGASRITQALMELGATLCGPAPACGTCPLSEHCGAYRAERTGDIPPIATRAKPKAAALWLLAFEAEGHLLLHPPATKGLLAGLWRWPTLDATETTLHAVVRSKEKEHHQDTKTPRFLLSRVSPQAMPRRKAKGAAQEPETIITWPGWTQVYTHRREAVSPLHIHLASRFEPAEGLCWVPLPELGQLPLGKRDQRLRDLLGTPGQVPLETPDLTDWIKAGEAPSA